MSKTTDTNIYFEIVTRGNEKRRIVLNLPKDEVDAGIYDFAQINIGNGTEVLCVGYTSEVFSEPLNTQN